MASPVSDDVACFESLPDDLVGIILDKLDFESSLRLTQACPTAHRLVKGERAVPGVFGKLSVSLVDDYRYQSLRIEVSKSGWMGWDRNVIVTTTDDKVEATAAGEGTKKARPRVPLTYLLEWIGARARAFTEIAFKSFNDSTSTHLIANTFLPNIPRSYRGKIAFKFNESENELAHLPKFLAEWRALAPAYECGLFLGYYENFSTKFLRTSIQAAPPLSSLTLNIDVYALDLLFKSFDTSRLKTLNFGCLVDQFPSKKVLFPMLQSLFLQVSPSDWGKFGAFLAPLHRLTHIKLQVGAEEVDGWNFDVACVTLAPFTALSNLRFLSIMFYSVATPLLGSKYWAAPIVLPALEELFLTHSNYIDPDSLDEGGGPAAGQSPRRPTLLSNLGAPKLERLTFHYTGSEDDIDARTLDLPLGRFPALRYFNGYAENVVVNLPALRAEVATLRHFKEAQPAWGSRDRAEFDIRFYAKDPVSAAELEAWEKEAVGFRVRSYPKYDAYDGMRTGLFEVHVRVSESTNNRR